MEPLTIEQTTPTQQRISSHVHLAEELLRRKYINQYFIYEDSRLLRERSIDTMPEDPQGYVEMMFSVLEVPILVDGIPETHDNKRRKEYRKQLHSEADLYHFYESNLLQSSNLANIFSLISAFQDDEECLPLSKKTMQRWEELRYAFNGHRWITKMPKRLRRVRFYVLKRIYGKKRKFVEHGLEPNMYKRMNNRKKLEFALKLRLLLEDVINEIMMCYGC